MDDIKLAMLGNRDAAKRLTDAGGAAAVPVLRWRGNGRVRHNRAV